MPDNEIRVFELVNPTVPPKGHTGDKFKFWTAREVFIAWLGTNRDRCAWTVVVAVRKNVGTFGMKVQSDNIHDDKGNNVLFLKGARQFGQQMVIREQRAVIKANKKAQKQSA